MKSYKIVIGLTLITLTVLCLGSCKTKKNTVNGNVNKNWEFSSALSDVLKNELQYTNLTAKGSLELKNGNSGKKTSAIYKLIKDSVIQVSVRAPLLGEIFCAHLTPEDITIVDRIKGQYVSEKYSESDFMKSIDFNFYNLQALLTDKLFAPGKQNIDKDDYNLFKMSKVTDVLMLQTSGKQNISYNFAVDATERIVSVLVTKKDLNSVLQFDYSEFVNDNEATYPTKIGISLSAKDYKLAMAILYSSVELNKKNMKVEISIPKRYDKVSIKELIEPYFNLK